MEPQIPPERGTDDGDLGEYSLENSFGQKIYDVVVQHTFKSGSGHLDEIQEEWMKDREVVKGIPVYVGFKDEDRDQWSISWKTKDNGETTSWTTGYQACVLTKKDMEFDSCARVQISRAGTHSAVVIGKSSGGQCTFNVRLHSGD